MKDMPAVKRFMQLQDVMGRIGVFILGPLYFIFMRAMGYRVRNLKAIREACHSEFRKHDGPWVICANHLTMVDSMILTYGMFSLYRHFSDFRRLPWNLPERNNFQRNVILAVLCYFAKCIPVSRGGDRDEMKKTLDRCDYVLSHHQNLLIFPEGGRSRSGRVDREGFSYGVGRFVKEFENCRILCIYLRGDRQKTFGSMPGFRERFTMKVEVLDPERPNFNGLRAQREYAGQIVRRLAEMEEEHFASCRERHRGSEGTGKQGEEPGCSFHQPRLHSR
jgi:1-acyl-sn-glycerol-3-phosphate acyltransferase